MEGLGEKLAKAKSKSIESDLNGSKKLQPVKASHWLTSSKTSKQDSASSKLKPLEAIYLFSDFVSPLLTNSDFDAKPMVILLGQYSTGKTTFIKHMLNTSYPGVHIGPEPTTDRFVRFIKASIPDNEMEKNLVVVSEEEVGSTKWYLEYLKPLVSKLDTPIDLRQHLAL
ncbi:hypothetical protein Dimus_027295, partial [Dionaea muscipula]